ncbi:MAG: DUF2306 domain-containing protein [Pseudomonadota bacterium]
MTIRWGALGLSLLMLVLFVMVLGFVIHATNLGWSGLTTDLTGISRLYSEIAPANLGIFAHMIAGAAITALAPLQLIPLVRRKWPAMHRRFGRIIGVAALLAGLGGLAYIALRGTVGGPHMSIAFAIYGALMIVAALQTIRHARARRFTLHQDWALRLFFLAIGSWLYRVHYGLWHLSTDGAGMHDDFTGPFDQVNLWAFYVPYLLILEVVLWRRGRGLFAPNARVVAP